MKIKWTVFVLLGLFTANVHAGKKQPPQILVLGIRSAEITLPQVRGLYDGLEEAGYVDGSSVIIRHVRADNSAHLRSQLAKSVHEDRIDVIVATSANETAVAKEVTGTIPIIFMPAIDPVGLGFVKSRFHPHANLTGLSFNRDVEDSGKQLSMFKQFVPALRRVVIFYDNQTAARISSVSLASVTHAARDLKLQLVSHPAASPVLAGHILQQMQTKKTDGVFVVCNASFRHMIPLTERAAAKSLPVFGCTAAQVADEGALMTYAPDIYYIGYRAAWYVDRILKGVAPEQLPVESPSRFEVAVNLKTARKLGVTIPAEMLILADKVF